MRTKAQKIVAVLIVCFGLTMLFYPWFSNWLYSHSVDSDVQVYKEETEQVDHEQLESLLAAAHEYNKELADSRVSLTDPFVAAAESDGSDVSYEETLSLDDSGLMCFIDIPKISVYLPVYHGTSGTALEYGAGHLEGSSLPVGGEDTRAVISAHTGINSSKMFSDLTEMKEGDLFFIHVLDETLAYRVCDVKVILPEDTGSMIPEKGRDLVSLLTCTPYGVNTHRLVVTGERTEYSDEVMEEAEASKDDVGTSQWMLAYRRALMIGLIITAIFVIFIKAFEKVKKKRENKNEIRQQENEETKT